MSKRKSVAVIGGGVSGLAAVKAFDERGHRVTGFERSHDLGGVWEPSRSYPDVQTQSPKDLYCYTDHPMPEEYPEWPKGLQVHTYLHSYAYKHKLSRLFRLNTTVQSMDRCTDGQPGWILTIEEADKARTEKFDFVVIGTGQFSDKNIITHPGQAEFEAAGGHVMHSCEYTDPRVVDSKHVVILGGSKSATDIAVNSAKSGARSTTLVYREPVWRIPYFIGGINFKHLLYMRAQEQQFNSWGRSALKKMVATVTKPLVWANFRGLEAMLKLQLGLKRWNMVPKNPIEKDVSCSIPIVTPGLFERFKTGDVKPIQGTFKSFEPNHVTLTTGDQLPCDVAIQAVGWKLGVPFLPQEYRDKIEEDGQYVVYRLAVNPDLPEWALLVSTPVSVLCYRYDCQLARSIRR